MTWSGGIRGWSSLFLLHFTYILYQADSNQRCDKCNIWHIMWYSPLPTLKCCECTCYLLSTSSSTSWVKWWNQGQSAVRCGERDSAAERPYYWPFTNLKVFYTQRGCDWHNICHAPGARIVCSAFHSIKAVVSQVTALRTGLQTCGINCKGHTLVPVCHSGTPTASGSVTDQECLA